jgi:RHS repeat-associated protein
LERDGAGSIAAVRHFVWGPDVEGQRSGAFDSDAEGVGGLLLVREWTPARGVKTYLPLTDGLGSVCGLVDAADGSLAAEYDCDPYGNPLAGRGPAADACPFRHRTRYYDPETWLYYYGYRYYDPSVTKWISKDPLGEAGGWNLTCFCGNDPINKYDPLGDRAYGNDFTGPLEWMDWSEKDYTQEQVDAVYAYLERRDRHIYNTGLGNTEADRSANKRLLEKALGVRVDMAWNPTFRRLGNDIMNEGSGIVNHDAPWYHLPRQTVSLAGGVVWLLGGALNVAGISTDVGVAAVEKVPVVRTWEPTYRDSMRLYKDALLAVEVQRMSDKGATVYGWMHSEGAIHGGAVLGNLSESELGLVRASTFGAGSYLFRRDARVRHYGNIDKWGIKDFVPGIAALNYVRNKDDVHWKIVDRIYMHDLPSYVRAHLIEDDPGDSFDGIARRYFEDNAKKVLGR